MFQHDGLVIDNYDCIIIPNTSYTFNWENLLPFEVLIGIVMFLTTIHIIFQIISHFLNNF